MARKRNPADVVVDYFQTAPLEAAAALLAVCKGLVERRQPARAPRTPRTPRTGASSSPASPPPADAGVVTAAARPSEPAK